MIELFHCRPELLIDYYMVSLFHCRQLKIVEIVYLVAHNCCSNSECSLSGLQGIPEAAEVPAPVARAPAAGAPAAAAAVPAAPAPAAPVAPQGPNAAPLDLFPQVQWRSITKAHSPSR
jgi:hypothetical protein